MKDITILMDMDDTLCDNFGQRTRDLRKIFKNESEVIPDYRSSKCPLHVQKKLRKIMSQPGWWENLPRLEDGFELYELAKKENAEIEILTRAPRTYPLAWTEKFLWCMKNVPDVDNINLTFKKKKYPGDILIDDWPEYITSWLDYNQNRRAILPLREWNKDYTHLRAVHYNGKNIEQVAELIRDVKARNAHL